MFDSLSIRLKIVLLSGLCLLGVVALIEGMNVYQTNQNNALVSSSSSQMLTTSVQDLLQAKAAEQAVRVQKTFGETQTVVTALADQIKDMRNLAAKRSLEPGALREELNQSLKTAFERNSKVLGIWLAFEPNGLDGKDSEFANDAARQSNEAGRFATYWSRAGGEALNTIMVEEDMTKTTLNLSGTPYNVWYTCPRDSKRTCLLDPYADTVGGKEVLMTTISTPLLVDGKTIGVVGVDIALNALQAAAVDSQRDLFNSAGHMLIVSGTGVMAAYSTDAAKVGKSIDETLGADGKDILQLLSGGAPKIVQQGDLIRAVYPVSPIPDAKAWGVVIDLPKQVLLADSVKLQAVLDDAQQSGTIKAVGVAIIAGLIGLLLIWLTASGVTRPINSVAEMLKAIASGDGDLTQRLHYSKKLPIVEAHRHFHARRARRAFLNRRARDIRAFVASLEAWVIATLDHFNVRGERREDRVGVWVRRPEKGIDAEDKIAAIGIRVRRWVTFHGISLNVEPNLEHFSGIVPCGIRGHGVTSLVDLGLPVTMDDADVALRASFEPIFGPTQRQP